MPAYYISQRDQMKQQIAEQAKLLGVSRTRVMMKTGVPLPPQYQAGEVYELNGIEAFGLVNAGCATAFDVRWEKTGD